MLTIMAMAMPAGILADNITTVVRADFTGVLCWAIEIP